MTIVFTENGSEIINDGLVLAIKYDREKQKVYILPADTPQLPEREITNVQQVVYNVQAEPRAINDSCEEIVHLRKMKVYTDRLRAFIFKLQDKNPELWEEIDREVKQEKPKLFIDEQDKSKPSD